MTAEQIKAMREWAAECVWAEAIDGDPGFLDELSDAEILGGIARHYVGGVEQFVADSRPIGKVTL